MRQHMLPGIYVGRAALYIAVGIFLDGLRHAPIRTQIGPTNHDIKSGFPLRLSLHLGYQLAFANGAVGADARFMNPWR
jgi:hypothetical protein